MNERDTIYALTVLQTALDFLDDGDSPAIGHLQTGDPVDAAYARLAGIIESARPALERMKKEHKS